MSELHPQFGEPWANECHCTAYTHWYNTDTHHIGVCQCGHPQGEHLDGLRSCTGEITTFTPTVKVAALTDDETTAIERMAAAVAEEAHPGMTCEQYEARKLRQVPHGNSGT